MRSTSSAITDAAGRSSLITALDADVWRLDIFEEAAHEPRTSTDPTMMKARRALMPPTLTSTHAHHRLYHQRRRELQRPAPQDGAAWGPLPERAGGPEGPLSRGTHRRPNRSNPIGLTNAWKKILNTLTIHCGDRIATTN